jgi:predicted alpha-1,2-mannosidase
MLVMEIHRMIWASFAHPRGRAILLNAAAALALICMFLGHNTNAIAAAEKRDLTQYVDPLIGSDGHGHVFVGANVPFGAVQLGPSNKYQGWDWCSAYHYSDNVLIGFSHLHLSGTGCADLGDVLLMPFCGNQSANNIEPVSEFASHYSHDHEVARPGYYAVELLDHQVHVELTATERVGFHRYTYPEGQPAQLMLDVHQGNGDERATDTRINRINEHQLQGHRFSTGWAADQRVFFAIDTSVPAVETRWLGADGQPIADSKHAHRAVLLFPPGTREVLVKVGLSSVSEIGARQNIDTEIPDWDFTKTADAANQRWNDALQSIQVEMHDSSQMRTFYTALYHTMFAPAIFNDANGDYRGANHEVQHSADFINYSVFSLWDTYRAAHPLLTITQPQRVNDMVQSMLAIYDQQGKLPVWHLLGNETNTMVGYHAVPVIVDAYLKGHRGFSADKAYSAVKASAMRDDGGLAFVKERGYIPADLEIESVAKGLEYAIDDWSIALMAEKMGHREDAAYFAKRAKNYRHYFDPQRAFMRGKLADGSWRGSFDPAASTHRRDDYCEGNAWQYTWLVPHDVDGLISAMEGPDSFVQKLDQLFVVESDLGTGASIDISGLIGQYAHGNEPGHHIPYLFASAGKPSKTAEKVRQILTTMYQDTPTGLCGNEDCGQMSAWYVFSALGFYPITPAGGRYTLGSPLVQSATIRLDRNKSFQILARNNSSKHIYIASAELNEKPLAGNVLTHDQIMAGGKLVLMMSATLNDAVGTQTASRVPVTQ